MVDYRFIDDKADKQKIQHETGLTLLQDIIRDKFGHEITESDIVRGKLGKPYMYGRKDVFFNISHCDGLCCCIVCSSECGIDCEMIGEFRPNVIKRVFTSDELEWFEKIDAHDKPRIFFILWTLKEAYGKYTGRGIADMKNVSFAFDNEKRTDYPDDLLEIFNELKFTRSEVDNSYEWTSSSENSVFKKLKEIIKRLLEL